jgi:hypothetical protein
LFYLCFKIQAMVITNLLKEADFMEVEEIWDITIKRKKIIAFLLDNPGLSSIITNLCLDYIDILENERYILIEQQERH